MHQNTFGNMMSPELSQELGKNYERERNKKYAERITKRFLKNNPLNLLSAFSVRGGMFNALQTSHDLSVYEQVDAKLAKKDIVVYRAPDEHKDYIGILAIDGVQQEPPLIGLPEGAVQIYPPTPEQN